MSDKNNPNDIQEGDVVRLVSGEGPRMVVEKISKEMYGDHDKAWCTWFVSTDKKTDTFELYVLMKVDPAS